jgi:glutamate N-acetyltransferase / amino-acid N-acetyltransferase
MSYTIVDDGHISSPNGYRSTGVSCGLKGVGKARDIALVYSQFPCKVASLFTTSVTKAAPVFLSQAILSRNRDTIRAVLINAGHANAATGQQGLNDAVECAKMVADECEVQRDEVLLLSTGIIGVPLPMPRMRDGIRRAVSELDSGGGRRAAVAIMTTDSKPKERAFRVQVREGRRITLAGMAKGTRMIHPRLATMLCVLTTDLPIEQRLLQRALQHSVEGSFHRLDLDGDPSPNDAVLLLANGAAEGPLVSDATSREFGAFQEALDELTLDLAQQIVRDAAGSGKIIQVTVRNAANEEMARLVAERVAESSAVRAACSRGQADWGTIYAAVGASCADLRPELFDLRIGNLIIMQGGTLVPFDANLAIQHFTSPEIEIGVDLHLGPAATSLWTCTWNND